MQRSDRRTFLKGALLPIAGAAGLPSLSAAVEQATTPYNRPKLKITDVRTAEVRGHGYRSEEHTSELQSLRHLVCRLLLEKKKDGRVRWATRIWPEWCRLRGSMEVRS